MKWPAWLEGYWIIESKLAEHLVNHTWPSATLAHENDRDLGLERK